MPTTINPLYTAQAEKRGVRISPNTTRIITRGKYHTPFDEEYRKNTIRTKNTNGNPLHTVVPTLPPGSLQRARQNNIRNTSTCEPGTSGCLPFWPFSRGGKTRRNRNKRSKTRSSRRV